MSEYDKQRILMLEKENKQLKEKLEGSVKKKPKKKVSRYTRQELFDMNKSEQIKLIRNLGHNKIPRKEVDRVELILKLAV